MSLKQEKKIQEKTFACNGVERVHPSYDGVHDVLVCHKIKVKLILLIE